MALILKNGSVNQTNLSCVVGAFVSPTWQLVIIGCVAFLVLHSPPNQGVWGKPHDRSRLSSRAALSNLKALFGNPQGRALFPRCCGTMEVRKGRDQLILWPIFRQQRICLFRTAPSRAREFAGAVHHGSA